VTVRVDLFVAFEDRFRLIAFREHRFVREHGFGEVVERAAHGYHIQFDGLR
jgi:hypothetical protein